MWPFSRHRTIIDVWQGPTYTSEVCGIVKWLKKKILKTVFANLDMYTKPSEKYPNDSLFGLIFAILYATWLKE